LCQRRPDTDSWQRVAFHCDRGHSTRDLLVVLFPPPQHVDELADVLLYELYECNNLGGDMN
jgi:hypothetical protein